MKCLFVRENQAVGALASGGGPDKFVRIKLWSKPPQGKRTGFDILRFHKIAYLP